MRLKLREVEKEIVGKLVKQGAFFAAVIVLALVGSVVVVVVGWGIAVMLVEAFAGLVDELF